MKKKQNRSAKRPLPKKVGSKPGKVMIHKLPTGAGGLDDILGGGIPEFSFNIIGGAPGCGKTTLAHQIAFANGTAKKPALYFTVLGEPALKMLRETVTIVCKSRPDAAAWSGQRISQHTPQLTGFGHDGCRTLIHLFYA